MSEKIKVTNEANDREVNYKVGREDRDNYTDRQQIEREYKGETEIISAGSLSKADIDRIIDEDAKKITSADNFSDLKRENQ